MTDYQKTLLNILLRDLKEYKPLLSESFDKYYIEHTESVIKEILDSENE